MNALYNIHNNPFAKYSAEEELEDCSTEVVPNSSITDLDELALAKARINFKKVHERIPAQEVDGWSVEDFLSHSEVMRGGRYSLTQ